MPTADTVSSSYLGADTADQSCELNVCFVRTYWEKLIPVLIFEKDKSHLKRFFDKTFILNFSFTSKCTHTYGTRNVARDSFSSYHISYIHSYTDGGGCHAKCRPAHQEQFWGSVFWTVFSVFTSTCRPEESKPFFICGFAETYFASIYSGGWIKLKQSENIPQMNPAGTARSSQACACDVGVL